MTNTQQALLKVKAFYIKQRADKVTQADATKLSRWLKDNYTGEDFEEIKQLNRELVHPLTTKERAIKERDKFYNEKYVRIAYLGGGWYSFSPNGHKYYTTNGDIKIHGYESLKNELESRGLFSISTRGYVGISEYIGMQPKKFFLKG